jgi:hypothetical protein
MVETTNQYNLTCYIFLAFFFSMAPSGKSLPGGFPGTGSRRSWGLPWQLGISHAGPRQNDAKLEKQLRKLQKTDQMINNFSFFLNVSSCFRFSADPEFSVDYLFYSYHFG